MVHFDTNFLIQTVVAGSAAHEKFRAWTQAQEECNASSIAWAEFLCGPLDAPAEAIARQIFPHPEPFLTADAVLAARLFNSQIPEFFRRIHQKQNLADFCTDCGSCDSLHGETGDQQHR